MTCNLSFNDVDEMLGEESTTFSGDSLHVELTSTNNYGALYPEDVSRSEEQLKPEATKGKVGRKEAPATKMFSALRTKNGKPLKKEYVRCQIIRGIKKCVRHIETSRIPNKGIHEFDSKDEEKRECWHKLENLVRNNSDKFANLGSTWEGPATDGKVIRKRQRMDTPQFRSFNDDYCIRFYENDVVREFHYLFLQLVYGTRAVIPEMMCKKLSVRCCDSKLHSSNCREVWENVRYYVTFTMIDQLKLKPYGMQEDIFSSDPLISDYPEEMDIEQDIESMFAIPLAS